MRAGSGLSAWRAGMRRAGLVGVLTAGMRDTADKVRRRMAATLGELLFYIAMQPTARTLLGNLCLQIYWTGWPRWVGWRVLTCREEHALQAG